MSDETPTSDTPKTEATIGLLNWNPATLEHAIKLERELNEALALASTACECYWTNTDEQGSITWGGTRLVKQCSRCARLAAMKGQG